MNTKILSCLILLFWINISVTRTQPIKPVLVFQDHPLTHNFHLASNGKFYYAINGGRSSMGQIKKYDLSGALVDVYPIDLDMRSIMYEPGTNRFFIYANDCNIYVISDMLKGTYKLVYSKIYANNQATPALSPDGKYLYFLEDETLKIFKFSNGQLYKEIKGIKSGDDFGQGSISVAVDRNYIYTWNAEKQIIYVYDLSGKFEKSVTVSNGSFGASLSAANGFVFVSDDGNYETGVWYGYDLRAK